MSWRSRRSWPWRIWNWSRRGDAEILIDEVQLRYGQLSEEMLCRFGRLWKDAGSRARAKDSSGAGRLFQLGLDWYQKAYAIHTNYDYYPGINVATLQFVLGQRDPARKTTEDVLSTLASRTAGRDELAWIWATQAEAQLLLASFPPDYPTGDVSPRPSGSIARRSPTAPGPRSRPCAGRPS